MVIRPSIMTSIIGLPTASKGGVAARPAPTTTHTHTRRAIPLFFLSLFTSPGIDPAYTHAEITKREKAAGKISLGSAAASAHSHSAARCTKSVYGTWAKKRRFARAGSLARPAFMNYYIITGWQWLAAYVCVCARVPSWRRETFSHGRESAFSAAQDEALVRARFFASFRL